MLSAGHRYVEIWERRARAIERTLRTILASDALNDDDRAAVVAVLCGRSSARDPKLLTDVETALIEHYRETTTADKQMLRTLLARLAAAGGTQ
jgi:hypothetical protein